MPKTIGKDAYQHTCAISLAPTKASDMNLWRWIELHIASHQRRQWMFAGEITIWDGGSACHSVKYGMRRSGGLRLLFTIRLTLRV